MHKKRKNIKKTDSIISSADDYNIDSKDVNDNGNATTTTILTIPSFSSSPITSTPTKT